MKYFLLWIVLTEVIVLFGYLLKSYVDDDFKINDRFSFIVFAFSTMGIVAIITTVLASDGFLQ